MVAWSNNPDWAKPLEREFCGRTAYTYTPCPHRRPCPVHDRVAAGPAAEGAPDSPQAPVVREDRRGPGRLPLPRFLDQEEA